jgi:hypothetical protein
VVAGPLRVVELLLLGCGDLVSFLEPAVLGRLVSVGPSFFPELPSVSSTSAISSSFPSLDRAAAAESGDDSDRVRPVPGSLSRPPEVYDCTSWRESLATAYEPGSASPEGFQPSSLDDQSDGFGVRVFGGYENVFPCE